MLKLFKNGQIYITETRMFTRADILTNDGIITDTDCREVSDGIEIIDCEGKYILPGLVDVHTHGRAGFDFNTADSDGCKKMREAYAKVGTTTVMATLASAPLDSIKSSISAIKENSTPEHGMATLAGIHLEGRYLNEKRRGAHATELLAPLDSDELRSIISDIHPLPAHVSAAFELCGGEKFASVAAESGATCGLAHSDATYDEALAAVEWGVTSFTHTFNAMRSVHHREPGGAVASLMCDNAYTEIICDGEHVHPAMIKLTSRAKPSDKIVLITDSMEATGCPDGEYKIAGLPVFVRNGRAVNCDGALAGSTLDLFKALSNYMSFTEKTLEESLPAATSNPAAMVGIDNICGKIKSGMRADFIMINDKNAPEIDSVWVCGNKI